MIPTGIASYLTIWWHQYCPIAVQYGVLGNATALADLERVQMRFLKILLGVPVHTKTVHVVAEFGRYPSKLTWQSQAAHYLRRFVLM